MIDGILVLFVILAVIDVSCMGMMLIGQHLRLNKSRVSKEIAKDNCRSRIEAQIRRETDKMLEEHRIAKEKREKSVRKKLKEREKMIIQKAIEHRKRIGRAETKRIIEEGLNYED